MYRAAALAVALAAGTAMAGEIVVYQTDFEAAALGDVDGQAIGAGTWAGIGDGPAAENPAIAERNGSRQLVLAVNEVQDGGTRSGSRAQIVFDNPLNIAAFTNLSVSFDLSMTAPRHNLYWDFDATAGGNPRQFFPNGQTINDGGTTRLIRSAGGNESSTINIGGDAFVGVNVRYEFDLVAGTVDTFFGETQVDSGFAYDANLFEGGIFSNMVFELAKDFRTADFGAEAWLDNFLITAIPTPGTAGLLALAGLAAARRRR